MADMRSGEGPRGKCAVPAGAAQAELCPPLKMSLRANPNAVRAALARVQAEIRRLALGEALAGTTELVLAEVLNNVVEHAQAGKIGARIELCMTRVEAGLHFEIRDTGRPMPGGSLPTGDVPEAGAELEELPEGGFGWFLIRSLAHNLSYRRDEDMNLLRFSLPAATDGAHA